MPINFHIDLVPALYFVYQISHLFTAYRYSVACELYILHQMQVLVVSFAIIDLSLATSLWYNVAHLESKLGRIYEAI